MQEALHRVSETGGLRRFWFSRPTIAFLLVAAVALSDRWLKALALVGLEFPIVGRHVRFELFRNEGIAFGLRLPQPLVLVLTAAVVAYASIIAVRAFRKGDHGKVVAVLCFIIGAGSNFLDRSAYGFTVDYFMFFSLSAWNLADGMILTGVAWLVWPRKG
jgi:lipoprotein signal peptidase